MNNSNKEISGWARAVMMLMNLVFVVLDTTGVKRDSDIISVLVVNLAGEEVYRQLVKPVRHTGEANTLYTGISLQELEWAETLEKQWPAITSALTGKFVIAYNLDFVQERLRENAQAYKLEPIYLVGECLHETSAQYLHKTRIALPAALASVGFPLPAITTAYERARAQIALLEAIAGGQPRRPPVIFRSLPDPIDTSEYNDLDDHPF